MADTVTRRYDSIVVGAGQSGGPLASELARSGRKTAIIEREHVGGTCINEGCTPTKTMVASARVAYMARRAADYGVHVGGAVSVDMAAVRQRKRDMVDSFRGGSERRLKETEGLDMLTGEAAFIGPDTLEVRLNNGEKQVVAAREIFLNTGARPARPPIEGLDQVPALNSTTIMELDAVPGWLLVVGGGYVGLEFAQMFRRFGSDVTIVARGSGLLAREDEDIALAVQKIIEEDGIEVLLEAEVTRVEAGDGKVSVVVSRGSERLTLSGTHLLVATGRTPNTDRLRPEAAGLKLDERGYIPVNERLETNVPGIWALGDVNGGPAFTHVSYDDYRIIRTNLLQGGAASTRDRVLPYTVYIDPQLGRVGMSEEQARKQGHKIRVAKMPMDYIARPLEVGEARGVMKAVVDAETDQILGAAVLGMEGGEIMSMLEIAMLGKVPYTVLKDAVFAHPSLAESLNNLFSNWED